MRDSPRGGQAAAAGARGNKLAHTLYGTPPDALPDAQRRKNKAMPRKSSSDSDYGKAQGVIAMLREASQRTQAVLEGMPRVPKSRGSSSKVVLGALQEEAVRMSDRISHMELEVQRMRRELAACWSENTLLRTMLAAEAPSAKARASVSAASAHHKPRRPRRAFSPAASA